MLAANSLATPGIGTIVWTTFIFFILLFLLAKFAWPHILGAVKAREESIKGSLEAAEQAREEMKTLKADNEIILRKAREERENMLREARDSRDALINEAKERASEEAEKLIQKAREGIEREKNAALGEIKGQVATLSVEIAAKILADRLKEGKDQSKYIDGLISDIDIKKN